MDLETERLPGSLVSATLTAIVVAYLQRNDIRADELPPLVARLQHILAKGYDDPAPGQGTYHQNQKQPAIDEQLSIEDDFIVCLEDGRKFRSLKRHLKTKYNLTPEEYRLKWGLPPDYPMVAPAYAAARSRIAKSLGLGVKISKRRC